MAFDQDWDNCVCAQDGTQFAASRNNEHVRQLLVRTAAEYDRTRLDNWFRHQHIRPVEFAEFVTRKYRGDLMTVEQRSRGAPAMLHPKVVPEYIIELLESYWESLQKPEAPVA